MSPNRPSIDLLVFRYIALYSVSHITCNLFWPGSSGGIEICTSFILRQLKAYGLNFICGKYCLKIFKGLEFTRVFVKTSLRHSQPIRVKKSQYMTNFISCTFLHDALYVICRSKNISFKKQDTRYPLPY